MNSYHPSKKIYSIRGKSSKIIVIFVVFLLFILAGSFFFYKLEKEKEMAESASVPIEKQIVKVDETAFEETVEDVEITSDGTSEVKENYYAKKEIGIVPFQVQAPGGKWSEPLFQNGCEEASMIMAARWVKNLKELDLDGLAKEMERVAAVEEKMFGHAVDTSVEDTCETIKRAFDVKNARVVKLETIKDISEQLAEGNLVVVNAFGRALGNPNFTSPGPITHMLVVIGYDEQRGQIITNDPGTRNGRGYRYDEDVFWKALWNYPTGEQHPEPPKNFGGPVKAIVVGR